MILHQGIKQAMYSELAVGAEFMSLLCKQGQDIEEAACTPPWSRVALTEDATKVYKCLNAGCLLLLSTTKKDPRSSRRKELENNLLLQAEAKMKGDTFEVVRLAKDIRKLLSLEGCLMESGVNLEIDLYMHGFSASGELPPVMSSSNNKMGIHSKVIQMNDSALIPRHRIDNKKVRVTPLAKKANVVNLGEVGCGDANILKKLAQLERDIHYVELRADCPFLEVVGYVSLGMARDQSLLAQTILMLQPGIFPYLVELWKRGSFVYLHNERGAFSDIQQIVERTGDIEKKLENVENKLGQLEVKTSDVGNKVERLEVKVERLEVKTSDVGKKVDRLLQIATVALLGAVIFGIKNIKHLCA